MSLVRFVSENPGTRFLFFAGKGGVGKSTMSCATSVWAAEHGQRVLLVTTDAAPNLADIFEQEIGNAITPIHTVENLFAVEIDPEEAAERYRERARAQFEAQFSGKRLTAILEELKSPCVEEVAALNEFTAYLKRDDFDLIVFDTAPTGHTLRLLELPGSWSMELSKQGYTCIGPNDALQDDKHAYDEAVGALTDPQRTRFVFVLKPESLAIEETERSRNELRTIGIEAHTLIVNGLLPDTPALSARRATQIELIESLRGEVEVLTHPLAREEVHGAQLLRNAGAALLENKPLEESSENAERHEAVRYRFDDSLEPLLAPASGTRYVFVMGKGGVGKSTIASILALHEAERSRTLLVTTDPADHLSAILETENGEEPTEVVENLFVANIDPERAHAEYKERKLREVLERIDHNPHVIANKELTRKKIEEELNSPCAQEVAYFEKFMSFFERDDFSVIVFDTAPTGHTLRMLELPSEWNDYVGASVEGLEKGENRYAKNIKIMRDPDKSSFVFVTIAEYTPMMEAWRASEQLTEFVGAKPALVIVNNTIEDAEGDPFLNARIGQQNRYVERIKERFATPIVTVPLFDEEAIGIEKLRAAKESIFSRDQP